MAKIPPLLYVSFYSQLVPAVAYVVSPRRTRIAAAIVVGALVSVLSNLIGRILADRVGNNQVASYLSSPVTAAFFLLALREWQITHRDRRVIQVALGVFLIVWVFLVAFVEDMRNFTVVSGPLFSLTLLVAAGWTLLRRAYSVEITPLTRCDWFWVSLGIAVYGACTALTEPIGAILLARNRFDLFNIAWQVRAALSTVGFLLMSWGIYRGPLVSKFSTAT